MNRFSFIIMLFLFILSGCQTVEQHRQIEARKQVEQRYIEEQVNRLQGEISFLIEDNAQLREELILLQDALNKVKSFVVESEKKTLNRQLEQNKAIENLRIVLQEELKSHLNIEDKSINGHEHIVEYGHTLSAIALAYGSTVIAIKNANDLDTDEIYIGQKLFIPE